MMTRRRLFASTGLGALAVAAGRGSHAAASRKLLITVLTCPRPNGVSYLEGTLDAIDADLSGHPRVLICDGKEPARRDGWSHLAMDPREKRPHGGPDNKTPGWAALELAANAGADLLFFEDDIRPMRQGAFAEMAAHRVADGADFATFFGAGKVRAVGVHRARDFELSQAVLLPLATMRRLLAARQWAPSLWSSVTGIDILIGALGNIEGMHVEQTDDLVRHVGVWSAVAPGEQRKF